MRILAHFCILLSFWWMMVGTIVVTDRNECHVLAAAEDDAVPVSLVHPMTGKPPPQGARCAYKGLQNGTWQNGDDPVPLYLNQPPEPRTWDISTVCPLAPKTGWDWVCCSQAQYKAMAVGMKILGENLHDCEACQPAIRNMFCHYQCSPYNHNFVIPVTLTRDRVWQGNLQITHPFADRVWKSCVTASIAVLPVKDIPGGVYGLLNMMAGFSPHNWVNGSYLSLIKKVEAVDHDANPYALGQNCTTVNEKYQCSCEPYGDCGVPNAPSVGHGGSNQGEGGSGEGTVIPHLERKTYPLPEAKIGYWRLQDVVGLVLGLLLILLALVGAANRDHLEQDEEELSDTSGVSSSANSMNAPHERERSSPTVQNERFRVARYSEDVMDPVEVQTLLNESRRAMMTNTDSDHDEHRRTKSSESSTEGV